MRLRLVIPLLSLLLCATEAWADVVVIVRREAEAAGNYVRICDIARVEGPKPQANEVAMIVLGPTPNKGQSQEFSRWDIETRLYEMGVKASVTFTGNEMVRVFGNGTGRQLSDQETPVQMQSLHPVGGGYGSLSRDAGESIWDEAAPAKPAMPATRRFEPAIKPVPPFESMSSNAKAQLGKIVSQYLAGRYSRADLEVEAKVLNVDAEIPESAYEIRVEEALEGRVPGKAVVRVKVKDTLDSEARSVVVSADTEVFGLAPVAVRPLTKGEELDSRDVTVTRVKMESGKSYLPPHTKSVTGRSVGRNLKAGEPVLASDTVQVEAVKRGDLVIVNANSTGWEIKTIGKAQGSGMVGDRITVKDNTTKKEYQARIVGPGEVQMIVRKDRLNDK